MQKTAVQLFDSFQLRSVAIPNRIFVSPMCQYSAVDGVPNEWHFVHLGTRAVGGAGLVFTEATAVVPEGRISPQDTGIWNDAQADAFGRIGRFVREQGAVFGMQLAHAGRKASTVPPWRGARAIAASEGGWVPVAPSALAFHPDDTLPRALTRTEIASIVRAFRDATERGLNAGLSAIEIHAAHGYLVHEFLSPLTNHRTDEYGGSFENRIRLLVEIVEAVRAVWPDALPLAVRLSVTDWVDGGWDLEQSIELARRIRPAGVDLIDCSSGGLVPAARMPIGPGYQTFFAAEIRRASGIATGAVGLITSAQQADHVVRSGQADCVLLARELLRDPYWPLRAARELGVTAPWPAQYLRAAPAGTPARMGS